MTSSIFWRWLTLIALVIGVFCMVLQPKNEVKIFDQRFGPWSVRLVCRDLSTSWVRGLNNGKFCRYIELGYQDDEGYASQRIGFGRETLLESQSFKSLQVVKFDRDGIFIEIDWGEAEITKLFFAGPELTDQDGNLLEYWGDEKKLRVLDKIDD
jgi:hypothetical protein